MSNEIDELEERIMKRLDKLEERLADDIEDVLAQIGAIQAGVFK